MAMMIAGNNYLIPAAKATDYAMQNKFLLVVTDLDN